LYAYEKAINQNFFVVSWPPWIFADSWHL